MSPKHAKRTSRLLATIAAAFASVSALGAVLQDNFNDNVTSVTWVPFNANTTKVKETTQRLCFKSTSDTNGLRRAGYASNGWTYKGEKTATIKFDYKVNVPGLGANETAAVGVYTPEPDDDTALEVLIVQKGSTRYVEYELFVDEDDGNGLQSVDRKTAPITSSTGTVEVKYVQSSDTMTIKVNGVVKLTIPNLNAGYGPFDLEVEAFGWTNKTSCTFAQVWLDNFYLQGAINNN